MKRRLLNPENGSPVGTVDLEHERDRDDRQTDRKRPEAMDFHVGGRVRMCRALVGVSAARLGDAVGCNRQQIDKYETGRTRIPVGRLYAIAVFLHTPPQWFFEDYVAGLVPSAGAASPVNDLIRQPGVLETATDYARLLPDQKRAIREVIRCMTAANRAEAEAAGVAA